MLNSQIPEKKYINDIMNMKFYISAYQRGYRWTSKEVSDLLNDIFEFDAGTQSAPKTYCIQPLIVVKRDDDSYEVVDGQQRLTTLFIILKYCEKFTSRHPYSISFETRKGSEAFLNNISNNCNSINYEYIDYYYISQAYNTIEKWFNEKKKKQDLFIIVSLLYQKILQNVFFIWHELPKKSNVVDIFNKVNMGKITLCNSELIKALLFNKKNFSNSFEKEQEELSSSWNQIERKLQNDSFWLFLNEPNEYQTRIDLLFDLISQKYNKNLPPSLKIDENNTSLDANRTFLIFYESYKNAPSKKDFVNELWLEVERYSEMFQEWYEDTEKYHIIGYLIASGVSIEEIFNIVYGNRKSESKRKLISKIKRDFKYDDFEQFSNITYQERKDKLRKIFLLFNIATLICKSECNYRFPFDIYKKEKWDIEHIHAKADTSKNEEIDDSISNLTLLSASINREYKDAPFNEKRIIILEKDAKGIFVPLCTKNVFTKQYTQDVLNMDNWEVNDKEDYILNMWNTIQDFLEKGAESYEQ